MPRLIGQLLKDQAKVFLLDNEIEFPQDASKDALLDQIRATLTAAGVNPEFYDFESHRDLSPGVLGQRRLSGHTPEVQQPDRFSLDPASTSAKRWETWVEAFGFYWDAASFPELPEKKRAVLLHAAGPDVQVLTKGLAEDSSITNPYERILTALSGYFNPRKNPRYERFLFLNLAQGVDETMDSFLSRLRLQTKGCEFGDPDDRILDQIVFRCSSDRLREKLWMESKLTLARAMEIARVFESSIQQTEALKRPSTPSTDLAVVQEVSSKCLFCATFHVLRKELCPARNARCRKCSRIGHYAGTPRCPASKPAQLPAGRNSPQQRLRPSGAANVRKAIPEDVDLDNVSPDEEIFFTSPEKSKHSLYTTLSLVGGKITRFLLDTGASCNLLPATSVPPGTRLSSPDPIRLYDGSLLPTRGKVILRVLNPKTKQQYRVLFIVVESGEPILGLKAVLGMKLLTVNPRHVHQISEPQFKRKWDDLLKKHEELFSPSLGEIKGVTVSLRVREGAKPVFVRARPVPFALREKIDRALDRAVRQGTLERVDNSEWSSPTVNVPKSDGDVRVCADFKNTVNPQLIIDEHPLPQVDDLFAQLAGTKFYTKLDFSRYFEQLVVEPESREMLTINTHRGLFRFRRLPYGVASAPAVAQRTMEMLTKDLVADVNHSTSIDQKVWAVLKLLCFLDDLLLASDTMEGLLKLTDRVLLKLKDIGARLNKAKCEFGVESVKYLGHVISQHGVQPDPDKVSSVLNAPEPKNKTELRSMLGMTHYYGKYCPDLATVCTPLYGLLKDGADFVWSQECSEAFSKMKTLLTSAPVLAYYDPKKELILSTDASPTGVGAVLSMIDEEGKSRPIAYAHKALSVCQRRYAQIDREAFGVLFGVTKFSKYLYGREFTIETDHQALVRILGEKCNIPSLAAARLHRWALYLSQFRYKLRYTPGSSLLHADALSRLPVDAEEDEPDIASLFFLHQIETLPVDSKKVEVETAKDEVLKRVVEHVHNGWSEAVPGDADLVPFFRRRDALTLQNGVLLWGSRVVLPQALRPTIMQELHRGHPGIVRMKQLARTSCWWPGLDGDIEDLVQRCDACQEHQPNPPKPPVLHWAPSPAPWERIHIDYAPKFKGKALLIVVDAFSNWVEVGVTGCDNMSSQKTIQLLMKSFARYGFPKVIVSDNGRQFTSEEFKNFCSSYGITQKFTAPYSPQTNGLAEKTVGVVKRGLLKIMSDSGTSQDLEQNLEKFLLSYRSTPSASGLSPAERFLGRPLRTRLSLLSEGLHYSRTPSGAVQDPFPKPDFAVGDGVMFRSFSRGPYWLRGTVVKVSGPRNFVVQDESGQKHRRHRSQIRKRN